MIEKILTEKRFYMYAIMSIFVPVIICLFTLHCKEQNLKEKAYMIERIVKRAKKSSPQRNSVELFLKQHSNVDESYIENTLESLTFLKDEKNALEPLLSHPAFKDSVLSSRYAFLSSNENKLVFIEDQPKSNSICKEALVHQKHPVEIDKTDLINILELIESKGKNKPQLLFKSFSLIKNSENTFNLKMDLLRREFSS